MNENTADGLREEEIPADMLPKVRAWWNRQMAEIAKQHGAEWPKHRDWIADYLNAEVRERLAKPSHSMPPGGWRRA